MVETEFSDEYTYTVENPVLWNAENPYMYTVVVKGKTFQEVAMFVGKVLAPMNGVISTSTHFVLRRYKEMDVIMCGEKGDDRGSFWL